MLIYSVGIREGYVMKEFIRVPIIILALFIVIPFYNIKAEERLEEYKVDSLLSVPKIKLKDNPYIMDYKYDDVNGDHIKDNIILVGSKNEELTDIERENIKLIIQDGKNKKYYKLSPGKFTRGNNGKFFLGDFNGDKVLDVFISICGEAAGEYPWYSLISFKDNKAKYLFEQQHFTLGLSFNIDFVDEYKISVFNRELNKFYKVDAANKKDTYSHLGIYDEKGELIKVQEGFSGAISELRPIDMDKDGVYEIIGIQSLSGVSSADIIGYAKSLWKCKDNSMKLLSLEILPYAKPGNLDKPQSVVPVNSIIN
jgi:hypothetical protein